MTSPYKLYALRYDNTRASVLEVVDNPANIGIRWALPGGVQRIEVTVKATSRADAYGRYTSHLGGGWAIADNWFGRPIADGWCYEIVPDGRWVTYLIGGAWKRHSDQYETTAPDATDTTDEFLKQILTDHLLAVNTDHSNIVATGTAVGDAFRLGQLFGTRPERLIKQIIDMGTSSDATLDYYLVPAPFDGTALQLPYAYLQPRSDTADISWQCDTKDLKGVTMSRNIWNLGNNIAIGYTQATTLAAGASAGATSISVTSNTNLADNVQIRITLDSGTEQTTTINGALTGVGPYTANLDDALTHAAASGNRVERTDAVATAEASDADSVATYWGRGQKTIRAELNQAQAEQYRDAYLAEYKDPAQETSFTIGSGRIRNSAGALYPVWRMLINPGYIRINDLMPSPGVFSASRDRERVFFVAALDYDHNARSMRVTPDAAQGDRRLDVLLQNLGAEVGQIVGRQT
jgi:hypothetical protein